MEKMGKKKIKESSMAHAVFEYLCESIMESWNHGIQTCITVVMASKTALRMVYENIELAP